MAKKLINTLKRTEANQQNSKVSPKDLHDYSVGAFLTDEENRTLWVNGMPYGNAYISFSEDKKLNTRQPKHAEIFNDFEHNKAEGHYSHAEGGAYVNTVYNNAKITYLTTVKTIEGIIYRYSVPYTSVLYKMIQVMANKDMNIPLYVVVNNEGRLDPTTTETYVDNDNRFNGQADDMPAEVVIDTTELGNTSEVEYNKSVETKYYIKAAISPEVAPNETRYIYFNVATSFTSEPTKLPDYCDGKTMYFHYYYAYNGSDGWTEATKDGAHAEGISQAHGVMSHTEGFANRSYEDYSHTEGVGNEVYGLAAHAEGDRNIVTNSAPYSHAEGHMNIAKADSVHVEGRNNLGNNTGAHVEGGSNVVNGIYGHAEGYGNTVNDDYGHAEGLNTENNGKSSHTEGIGTITNNDGEHAEGTYNYSTPEDNFISTVGIGSSDNDRKNAIAIDKNGLIYISKTLETVNNSLTEYNPCKYDGQYITDDNISVQRLLTEFSQSMINVTYAELLNYIENENLIPGKFYRITDYYTNISLDMLAEGIKSAGHEFDIIVLALSNDTLSENAYATYKSDVKNINLNENVIELSNGEIIATNDNGLTVKVFTYDNVNNYYNEIDDKTDKYLNNYEEKSISNKIVFNDAAGNQIMEITDTSIIGDKMLWVSESTATNSKKYVFNYLNFLHLNDNTDTQNLALFNNYDINSFVEAIEYDNVKKIYLNNITINAPAEVKYIIDGNSSKTTFINFSIKFKSINNDGNLYITEILPSADTSNSVLLEALNNHFNNRKFNSGKNATFIPIVIKALIGTYSGVSFNANSYFDFDGKNTVTLNTAHDDIGELRVEIPYSLGAYMHYDVLNKNVYSNFSIRFLDEEDIRGNNLQQRNLLTYGVYRMPADTTIIELTNNVIFPKLTQIINNLPQFISSENSKVSNNYYLDITENGANKINLPAWKLKYNYLNTYLQNNNHTKQYYTYYDELVDNKPSLLYFDKSDLDISFYTNNSENVSDWNIIIPDNIEFNPNNFKNYTQRLNQVQPIYSETDTIETDIIDYTILSNKIYPLSKTDETYLATLCKSDKIIDLEEQQYTFEEFNTLFFKPTLYNKQYDIYHRYSQDYYFAPRITNYTDEFGFIKDNTEIKNWLMYPMNASGNPSWYLQVKKLNNTGDYLYNVVTYKNQTDKIENLIPDSAFDITTNNTNLSYIIDNNTYYFLLKNYDENTHQYNLAGNSDTQTDISICRYSNPIVNKFIGINNDIDNNYYVYVSLVTINDVGEDVYLTNQDLESINDLNTVYFGDTYIVAKVLRDESHNNYDIALNEDGTQCIYRVKMDMPLAGFKQVFKTNTPLKCSNIHEIVGIYTNCEKITYGNNEYNLQSTKPKSYKTGLEFNIYYNYNTLIYNGSNYSVYKNETIKDHCIVSNMYLDAQNSDIYDSLLDYITNYSLFNKDVLPFGEMFKYTFEPLDSNNYTTSFESTLSTIQKYDYLQIVKNIDNAYEKIEYNLPYYFGRGNIYGLIDEYNNSFGYDVTNILYRDNENVYRYTFDTSDNAIRYGYIRNNRFSASTPSGTGGILDKTIINCGSTGKDNIIVTNNDFTNNSNLIFNAKSIKVNNCKFSDLVNTTFDETDNNLEISNSIFSNITNSTLKTNNYNGVIINNINNNYEYVNTANSLKPLFAISNFRIFDNNVEEVKTSGLYNDRLSFTSPTTVINGITTTGTIYGVNVRTGADSNDSWNYMYNNSEIKFVVTINNPKKDYAYKLHNKRYLYLGYLQGSTHFRYNWHRHDGTRFRPDIHLKFKPTITVKGAFNGSYTFGFDEEAHRNAAAKTDFYDTFISLIAIDISKLSKTDDIQILTYNGDDYVVFNNDTGKITVDVKLPKIDNGSFFVGAQNDAKTTGHTLQLSNVIFVPYSTNYTDKFVLPTTPNEVIRYPLSSSNTNTGASNHSYYVYGNGDDKNLNLTKYLKESASNNILGAICKDGIIIKCGAEKHMITKAESGTNNINGIFTTYTGLYGSTATTSPKYPTTAN